MVWFFFAKRIASKQTNIQTNEEGGRGGTEHKRGRTAYGLSHLHIPVKTKTNKQTISGNNTSSSLFLIFFCCLFQDDAYWCNSIHDDDDDDDDNDEDDDDNNNDDDDNDHLQK